MNLFALFRHHSFADKREDVLASIAHTRAELEAMPATRDVYHDHAMLARLEKQMKTTLMAPRGGR